MPFRESLRNIVDEVDGGVGAVIMGYDGIPIDEYFMDNPDIDVQSMAVEYAHVLKEIKRTVEVLKTGMMEEVSINTELSKVLIKVINDEFFVALALRHDGNYGKGRYLLKRESSNLKQELS